MRRNDLLHATLCAVVATLMGCASTHMELRPAPTRVEAVALARIDSTFALKPDLRTELENVLRSDLPRVPDTGASQRIVVRIARERHHQDVTVGGHGDSIDYDYVSYEVRVTIVDAQQRELGFCRLTWEEPDVRAARDREERALAAALRKATRALLGDVPARKANALLATATLSAE